MIRCHGGSGGNDDVARQQPLVLAGRTVCVDAYGECETGQML